MISKLDGLLRQAADEYILPLFEEQKVTHQTKLDGSVITEVDGAVQQFLESRLNSLWPDIAFLGEEMPAPQQQEMLNSQAVWCLDPLDGTSNYASGIPFFAISLALIENQQTMLGIIYDPVRKECFSAIKGEGSYLNGSRINNVKSSDGAHELKEMIAVVDLKRLLAPQYKPLLASICDQHPYRSQRNFGSCAVEWCWLAAGRFQIYIHGGQKLWDYAAGILILTEAGGHASTVEGESIVPESLTPQSVVAGSDNSAYKTWFEWINNNKHQL